MSGNGADVAAKDIFDEMLEGVVLPTIPAVDLDSIEFQLPDPTAIGGEIVRLTNEDLTTRAINGNGAFDALMAGFGAHLKNEFEKNRITGAQYASAFVELTAGAMGNAVQYLLGRDQAYWTAIAAQQNALEAQARVITARVQLEAAKVQLASMHLQMLKDRAEYALVKLKLATEDQTYGAAKFTLQYVLPQQEKLLKEQVENARAQTMDTRTDGITQVAGSIGKQKELYSQQITSYQRDSEVKAGKIFIDAWTVMKTIDEGLLPPTNFSNANLDGILSTLKTANGLD